MNNYFVTDTHALLWYLTDNPKLGPKAKDVFKLCELGEFVIVVPIIVLLEILDILEKKKINFDFDILLDKILQADNYLIQDLDINLFFEIKNIKPELELHDRVIVATAKMYGAKIITRDSDIQQKFAKITVW